MWKTVTQKLLRGLDNPWVIGALYFLIAGTAVFVMDHSSKEEIENILKRWMPWSLRLNFLVLLIAGLFCLRDMAGAWRRVFCSAGEGGAGKDKCRWKIFSMAALLLAALILVSFTVPRVHRIYYDEDIYANMGQMIALTGQTGFSNYGIFEYGKYDVLWSSYNKEPSGWPFLISLVFQLFGVNELYAFFLNNAFFIAGIAAVFFIAWHLTGAFFGAFMAAALYALIPDNLIWSNTLAAEPSAALFSGLIVLVTIVFLKTGENRHLFLLAALLPFASQMRPESLMMVPWAIAAVLILSPRTLGELRIWRMGLLAAFFFLPQALHFFAVSGHSWGSEGVKFALSHFPSNLKTNGLYYLNNESFPSLFTLFAAAGLFFGQKKFARLLVAAWFMLFWGIFLFFYAGSYKYGADVRFAVVSFMPLAVLGGAGAELLKRWMGSLDWVSPAAGTMIAVILFVSWLPFLPHVRTVGQEAWGARCDHKFALEFIQKIPERSIVLTHNPTMFNLWGRNAIQMYAGINHPDVIRNLMARYPGEVYFHRNYWCNTRSEVNRRLCQGIADRYDLAEVAHAREQDFEYGLYRMTMK